MKTAVMLLTVLISLLLLIPIGYCGFSQTIPYTDFNKVARTDYATQYTESSWTVTIKNDLAYNTTGTHYAKIFISNSSGTGYFAVNLNLAPETSGDGYSLDCYVATKVDPQASDWLHLGMIHNLRYGEKYKVSLQNGVLTVKNGIGNVYLSKTVNKSFPASYIGVCGSDSQVATLGSVTVSVGKYEGDVVETVFSFIPIIVIIAMVGIALSLIRRV